jgi:predicted NBD/HSP70 family sugar kinase
MAALGRHGELPRDQLARLSGLPRSTVTDAVARLRRHGIVVERTTPVSARSGTGRPPTLLALAAPSGLVAVIALTHVTLQAGVVGFDGTVHARQVIEPYVHDAGTGIVEQGIALLNHALRDASRVPGDLTCAVIGMPMPVTQAGQTALRVPSQEAYEQARGKAPGKASIAAPWLPGDPSAELGRRLGVPAWAENDANLGAMGEGTFGAAAGLPSFIYIKIAHGIGAGLVLDGRLHRGAHGLAGELAHLHVERDGSLCRCGGRGCLMTTFNTPRLIDWISTVHPGVTTMADVISLAADGDAGVLRLLRDLGRTIGRSLADFCLYAAPDGIVLDGILQNASAPVISGIEEMLYEFAPPAIASHVRVVVGLLDDRAELHGAAILARQRQFARDRALAPRARTAPGKPSSMSPRAITSSPAPPCPDPSPDSGLSDD